MTVTSLSMMKLWSEVWVVTILLRMDDVSL